MMLPLLCSHAPWEVLSQDHASTGLALSLLECHVVCGMFNVVGKEKKSAEMRQLAGRDEISYAVPLRQYERHRGVLLM